jgi:hypothetical protein
VLIIPSSWGSQLDDEKPSTPCRINGDVTSKIIFYYHLPTQGRAGGKLGDVDTLQTYL